MAGATVDGGTGGTDGMGGMGGTDGAAPRLLASHRAFGGTVSFHAHASRACATEMRFSVYVPPAAAERPVPALLYLAGLTCTEETFMVKAGALRAASELGLMLVAPDTSPRGARLPGDDAAWDFGLGAGFYLDATRAPWAAHYRLHAWVADELPALLAERFPTNGRLGVFGHSMGGHGALVCALRRPDRFASVSALAPIVAPMRVPWGRKAFAGYLGEDEAAWRDWDATELVRARGWAGPILVDQGTADKFLAEQLRPELLEAACAERGVELRLRRREGYDHGYWFVSSFVEEHLRFHHAILAG